MRREIHFDRTQRIRLESEENAIDKSVILVIVGFLFLFALTGLPYLTGHTAGSCQEAE